MKLWQPDWRWQIFLRVLGYIAHGVVICHCVSSVEHADYIYVISNGKVTPSGTHQELLKMKSDYALLFNKNIVKSDPA